MTTRSNVPRTGLMLVGLGGNNGTTLTGMLFANKHELTWHTKTGIVKANFLGSVSQVGTVPLGLSPEGQEIFAPIRNMVNECELLLKLAVLEYLYMYLNKSTDSIGESAGS